MRMNLCWRVFPALLALAFVSCHGTKEITIYTQPEGANVSINGKPIEGKTPLTTTVEQDKDLGIVVDKPGYRVASKTVYTQTSWWLRLLWSKNDPRSQYIEEDEVFVPMEKISSAAQFVPSKLPEYTGSATKREFSAPPPLRPMPELN